MAQLQVLLRMNVPDSLRYAAAVTYSRCMSGFQHYSSLIAQMHHQPVLSWFLPMHCLGMHGPYTALIYIYKLPLEVCYVNRLHFTSFSIACVTGLGTEPSAPLSPLDRPTVYFPLISPTSPHEHIKFVGSL